MNEARQLRRRVLAHVRSYRHGTTAYEVAVALGVATDQAAIVLGLLHARGLVAAGSAGVTPMAGIERSGFPAVLPAERPRSREHATTHHKPHSRPIRRRPASEPGHAADRW